MSDPKEQSYEEAKREEAINHGITVEEFEAFKKGADWANARNKDEIESLKSKMNHERYALFVDEVAKQREEVKAQLTAERRKTERYEKALKRAETLAAHMMNCGKEGTCLNCVRAAQTQGYEIREALSHEGET